MLFLNEIFEVLINKNKINQSIYLDNQGSYKMAAKEVSSVAARVINDTLC